MPKTTTWLTIKNPDAFKDRMALSRLSVRGLQRASSVSRVTITSALAPGRSYRMRPVTALKIAKALNINPSSSEGKAEFYSLFEVIDA